MTEEVAVKIISLSLEEFEGTPAHSLSWVYINEDINCLGGADKLIEYDLGDLLAQFPAHSAELIDEATERLPEGSQREDFYKGICHNLLHTMAAMAAYAKAFNKLKSSHEYEVNTRKP